ncbi:PBECR2 nuclease fold domain-containing protein [Serratia liquefaciens]|uniref:PBECR2 nuclease fold domain-containing protein n=1 Tax=Serratia liquefaciens TaxID=614 RepID=UPI00218333FD|nr:PBECR2 nuclease fold domain-containing protein [Serratia liquefaciens]CAI2537995.1 Uncharacterised protein [Serratia liquefaciens]
MSKARGGLQTFIDLDLPDLRTLDRALRREALEEVTAAPDITSAIAILEQCMGFYGTELTSIAKQTPIGTMNILRDKLEHIVEKRPDARERYVNFALDTLHNPFEVWSTPYDDDMQRFIYIGAYDCRQQMLVVVAPWDDRVLWNFMHSEAKKLNRHRQGELLYKRYP